MSNEHSLELIAKFWISPENSWGARWVIYRDFGSETLQLKKIIYKSIIPLYLFFKIYSYAQATHTVSSIFIYKYTA